MSTSSTPGVTSRVQTDPHTCPSPHSRANQLARIVWGGIYTLFFRPSPRPCHAWRRGILRLFRATVGRGVKIMPSVRIWAPWNLTLGDYTSLGDGVDAYSVDRIDIGAHATISQRAFLCTASHDPDHPHMPLTTAPIHIGDGAWVCAEAYLHPGVRLGIDAVAGVRAVVLKDIPDRMIAAGHPARVLRPRRLPDRPGEARP